MTAPATASQTPDQFKVDVKSALDTIVQKVRGALETCAHALEKIGIGGTVLFPISALGWGAIVKKFESFCKDVWKQISNFFGWVWDKVSQILGNPFGMITLSTEYVTVKSKLLSPDYDEAAITRTLAYQWQGDANEAFTAVMGVQQAARESLAAAFGTASVLISDAAEALGQLWLDLLDELTSFAVDVAKELIEMADAGKAIFAEVGPALGAITTALGHVETLLSTFDGYILSQNTSASAAWRDLSTNDGGLPNLKWPSLKPEDSAQYGDSGNWQEKQSTG